MHEPLTHCVKCGKRLEEYEQMCYVHTCDVCKRSTGGSKSEIAD
jgi:predicted nucleic acid-binding Zn ribbon protein